MGKILGNPGTYGTVYEATDLETKKKYAAKKGKLSLSEYEIMKALSHKNIVRAMELYKTKQSTYIIMEKCGGVDLFEYVTKNEPREEKIIAILRQILEAVRHIHSKGIIHRDIKLSNIMIEDLKVKVIDFGSAIYSGDKTEDLAGSPGFISPEGLVGEYRQCSDMWAVGCVAFIMLFKFNPFNPFGKGDVVSNILKGFDAETHRGYGAFFPENIPVGQKTREFISGLLCSDCASRMTAEEALNHPWITA